MKNARVDIKSIFGKENKRVKRNQLYLSLCILLSIIVSFSVSDFANATVYECRDVASLRSAIIDANSTYYRDDPDTIVLTSGGDYTLSENLPPIESEVTIKRLESLGPGSTVIQRDTSATTRFRIFTVNRIPGRRGHLTLENMTIKGGDTPDNGGGIYIGRHAGLTLRNCNVRENSAGRDGGGIYSEYGGNIHIIKSVIRHNSAGSEFDSSYGGGIAVNHGSLTIAHSIVNDNTATDNRGTGTARSGAGGGVHSWRAGTLIQNSSISGNSASRRSGGINHGGKGATLTIANSTISGNRAQIVAAMDTTGPAALINSTVKGNRAENIWGGIFASLGLKIINSTITGNSAPGEPGHPDNCSGIVSGVLPEVAVQNSIVSNNTPRNCRIIGGGNIESAGNNIEDSNTCGFGSTGDHANTNPNLGAYIFSGVCSAATSIGCDNDGDCPGVDEACNVHSPGEGHFPLQSTSTHAIDGGSNEVYLEYVETITDQLHQSRADGDNNGTFISDIGAFEYQNPSSPDRYRFVVMADSRGDIRDYRANEFVNEKVFRALLKSVRELYGATDAPPPSLILFGGDLVKGHETSYYGAIWQLEHWINIVDDVMGPNYADDRILPAFGGHEASAARAATGFPGRFTAFSDKFDPAYLSFLDSCEYMDPDVYEHTVYYCDFMNARFFVLNNDSDPNNTTLCKKIDGTPDNDCLDEGQNNKDHRLRHEIGVNQHTWIGQELLINPKDHYFFMHHEPMYGVNAHEVGVGNNTNTIPKTMDAKSTPSGLVTPYPREEYWDVIDSHATMIFSGHEHQYARMRLDGDSGPYELKTGTCGAPVKTYYSPTLNESKRLFVPDPAYHYAVIDVADQTVSFQVFKLPTHDTPLPDNGRSYYQIDVGANIRSVTFHVDKIRGTYTGLAELKLLVRNPDDTLTNIATTADIRVCHPTEATCENANDGNKTSNWKTSFVNAAKEQRGVWITLGWNTAQWVDMIRLWDITDMGHQVTRYTVTWEDADGIPHVGDIERSSTPRFIEGISIDADLAKPGMVTPPFLDADGDGPFNSQEGREDYDGDKIPDYLDKDTARVTLPGIGRVTVDLPEDEIPGIHLSSVKAEPLTDSIGSQWAATVLQDKYFPYGVTKMNIHSTGAEGAVTVELAYPNDVPEGVMYYSDDGTSMDVMVPGRNDGDQYITVTLTDGDKGDSDGAANGQIIHRGGLALKKPWTINDFVSFKAEGSKYHTFTTDTRECSIDYESENPYAGTFGFHATLKNESSSSLSDLVVRLARLTNDNVLQYLEAKAGVSEPVLVVQKVDKYSDGILSSGESVKVHFVICLTEVVPFEFYVDVLGVADPDK